MMFSAKRTLSLLLVFLVLFSSAAYAADEELVDSTEGIGAITGLVEEENEALPEEPAEESPEEPTAEPTEFQKLKARFDNYCEAPYGEFEIVLNDDLEFEETLEIPDNAIVTVRPDDNVWDSVSLIHHKDSSPMFELKGANSVLSIKGRDNCSIIFRIPDMGEESIGKSLRGIENNGSIELESVSFLGFGNEEDGIQNTGYAVVNNANANASFLDVVADSNSVFNLGAITIEEDDTYTQDGCILNSGSGFVKRDGEPEEEPEETAEEYEENIEESVENVEESDSIIEEPEVIIEELEEEEESDSAFPAGDSLEQIPMELLLGASVFASEPQVFDAGQSVDEEIETVIQNQYEEVDEQPQSNWQTAQYQQEAQYQQNADYQDYSQKQAITVYASWNDNGNSAYRRPASTQINLYSNGSLYLNATLSSANNWTHTFVNLPIGPSYRIEETGIADYSTYYETSGNNVYIRNSYTGAQPAAQYIYQPQQTQQPAINYYSTQSTTYTAPPVRTSAPAATPVPTAAPTVTPVPTLAPASASPVPSPTPYINPDDAETESGTSSHAWIWVAVLAVSGAAAAGILVYLNSIKKQREAEARARERARKRAQMETEQRRQQTAQQRRPQNGNEQRRPQTAQRRPQTEEERSMQADIAAGVRRTREDADRRRSPSHETNSEYKPRH